MGIHPSQVEVLGFLPLIRTVRFALPMLGVVARLDESEPVFHPSPDEVEKVLTPSLDSLSDPGNWLERTWAGVSRCGSWTSPASGCGAPPPTWCGSCSA